MKSSFVKSFKRFLKFSLCFLGIIAFLSLWSIFTEKSYIKLLPLGFVLMFLMIMLFYLYCYFGKMAEEFSINDNMITFIYFDHTDWLFEKDIDCIVITNYQYIFFHHNKKITLSRIMGSFQLETEEKTEILDFAYRFHIDIKRKTF